jgi:GNAT superfamily N-acetyltransferase
MGALLFGSCIMAEVGDSILTATCGIYTFNHFDITDDSFMSEVEITCHAHGEEVGVVFYSKIPLRKEYVVHTLYVHPQYREQGHGTAMLSYVSDHLKAIGAKCAYIQPGPFEMGVRGEVLMTQEERAKRIQWLIAFYKKNQFTPFKKWLTPFMRVVYACMGIKEDPAHLMVKVLV